MTLGREGNVFAGAGDVNSCGRVQRWMASKYGYQHLLIPLYIHSILAVKR